MKLEIKILNVQHPVFKTSFELKILDSQFTFLTLTQNNNNSLYVFSFLFSVLYRFLVCLQLKH
jgi:hypothetical protein